VGNDMIRNLILTFIISWTFLSPLAYSQESTIDRLSSAEAAIEQRAKGILSELDPNALVQVKLLSSKKKILLPGVGMLLDRNTEIEIKNSIIEMSVYTELDPFPKDVDGFLRQGLKLGNSDLRIRYKKLPESILGAKASRKALEVKLAQSEREKTKDLVEGSASYLGDRLFPYFLGSFALLALVFSGIAWILRSGITTSLASLGQLVSKAFSGAVESGGQYIAEPRIQEKRENGFQVPTSFSAHGMGSTIDDFDSLSLESLEAIFSDAYWCEEDAYASYVWRGLRGDRRAGLINSQKVDSSFFDYIVSVDPVPSTFHQHPYYAAPKSFFWTSQEDVAKWLRGAPQGYHVLSPMRKKNLSLALEERIKILESPLKATNIEPPAAKSTFRKLPSSEPLIELNSSDEAYLFRNIQSIHGGHVHYYKTWIWIMKLGAEARADIWRKYSAQEIASSLTGPKPFLDWVLKDLPESKSKLVEAYLLKSAGSKSSHIFSEVYEDIRGRVSDSNQNSSKKAAA